MTQTLIWIHEEALRVTHPVFTSAPQGTRAVFVWDDKYFQQLDYSLKRLIFIYETLCELPVDIIRGDIIAVFKDLNPSQIFVPMSTKPHLVKLTDQLKSQTHIETIEDDMFVDLPEKTDLKRFFKYWNLAQETASQQNGGLDA